MIINTLILATIDNWMLLRKSVTAVSFYQVSNLFHVVLAIKVGCKDGISSGNMVKNYKNKNGRVIRDDKTKKA